MTNKQGVESNFVRYDRFKYRSRAQLQMIPADEPITTTVNLDAVTNLFIAFIRKLNNNINFQWPHQMDINSKYQYYYSGNVFNWDFWTLWTDFSRKYLKFLDFILHFMCSI